jgi:hypothetical protein
MMGRHHALLGGTTWMGMGALAGMPAVPLAASVAACAAAAMLPDIDEPRSTVAHLCGPVTPATAWLTQRLSGATATPPTRWPRLRSPGWSGCR